MIVFAGLVLTGTVGARQANPGPTAPREDPSLLGQLKAVDVANEKFTVAVEGQSEAIELFLTDATDIRQESRQLSVAEFAERVGHRVKVRYRLENGRRVARSITVERRAETEQQPQPEPQPDPAQPRSEPRANAGARSPIA